MQRPCPYYMQQCINTKFSSGYTNAMLFFDSITIIQIIIRLQYHTAKLIYLYNKKIFSISRVAYFSHSRTVNKSKQSTKIISGAEPPGRTSYYYQLANKHSTNLWIPNTGNEQIENITPSKKDKELIILKEVCQFMYWDDW